MTDTRRYPERPFVGVGAVIVDPSPSIGTGPSTSLGTGGPQVVLIRRRFEPLAGQWSLPGGAVEVGETLEGCVAREMREETGLEVEVGPVIEVFDRITRDDEGRVLYHYVLVDYLCWPSGGRLQAGSDVDAAAWADAAALPAYQLTEKATAVIMRGLELAREAPRRVR
jgi:8-oxo-dGTP diphosphatase